MVLIEELDEERSMDTESESEQEIDVDSDSEVCNNSTSL